MIEKCDYYMKPEIAPWRCNACPDYVQCAYDSGVVRSHNYGEKRDPYPWKITLSAKQRNGGG